MPRSDICNMKSRLVATARDLENADTLEKLKTCLREQRRLWLSLPLHTCPACQDSADVMKFANFVLEVLRRRAFPDDRHISELVSINLRTSDLLSDRCPQFDRTLSDRRPLTKTLAYSGESASAL